MLIDLNIAYNQIIGWILESDGRWEWDDTNYTDLPIGTTTITTDQQDYAIDTTHLEVLRVEIKDSNGNWSKIEPVDQEDEQGFSLSQLSTDTGVPDRYDLVGNSLFLYPVPNYTQAASIKIYFQRGPDEYTSAELTTGTKVPGFASTFHHLIAYMVALDFVLVHIPQLASGYNLILERDKKALKKFYGKRNRDDRPRMTPRKILYK
jgi:hypothetical protein